MKDISPASETTLNNNTDRKMSLPARGRRPSMFDPIDPKELQQALYASAAAVRRINLIEQFRIFHLESITSNETSRRRR